MLKLVRTTARMNATHVGVSHAKKFLRCVLQGTSVAFNMALTQITRTFYNQFYRGVEAVYGIVRGGCPCLLGKRTLLQVSC